MFSGQDRPPSSGLLNCGPLVIPTPKLWPFLNGEINTCMQNLVGLLVKDSEMEVLCHLECNISRFNGVNRVFEK